MIVVVVDALLGVLLLAAFRAVEDRVARHDNLLLANCAGRG
jgi:hypothetical protein